MQEKRVQIRRKDWIIRKKLLLKAIPLCQFEGILEEINPKKSKRRKKTSKKIKIILKCKKKILINSVKMVNKMKINPKTKKWLKKSLKLQHLTKLLNWEKLETKIAISHLQNQAIHHQHREKNNRKQPIKPRKLDIAISPNQ